MVGGPGAFCMVEVALVSNKPTASVTQTAIRRRSAVRCDSVPCVWIGFDLWKQETLWKPWGSLGDLLGSSHRLPTRGPENNRKNSKKLLHHLIHSSYIRHVSISKILHLLGVLGPCLHRQELCVEQGCPE